MSKKPPSINKYLHDNASFPCFQTFGIKNFNRVLSSSCRMKPLYPQGYLHHERDRIAEQRDPCRDSETQSVPDR